MKKYLLLLLVSCSTIAFSQADSGKPASPWTHGLVAGLTLTQVSYTNWAQGGTNALAWAITADGKSVFEDTSLEWSNTYKFAFGQTRLGSQGTRKTDDKIDFESILKWKMGTYINPYVAATIKSQFAPGYIYDDTGKETQLSKFFDPGYMTQSAGVGYQPIPEIKTRFGAAVREIFTSDYNQYADDPTTIEIEKTRVEGGLEWVTDLSWQLDDNLLFTSKIELFSPIKTFEETTLRADNTIAAKVNKYITVNLNLQLINDKKVSPYTQSKETLALGLTYSIF